MFSTTFWNVLLAKKLNLESSLEASGETLIISSDDDFSLDSSDLRIYNALSINAVTRIKLGERVHRILPFYGTHLLTSVDFTGSDVRSIPSFIFQNALRLTQVTLTPNIIEIFISAFENSAITTINLKVVRYIHNNAFYGCKYLEVVDVRNVTVFGTYSFSETGLISFTFIKNVQNVPEGMFKNRIDLETVTFSGGIRYIDSYSFYHCTKLTTVDGLSNVLGIYNHAFEYTSLVSLEFQIDSQKSLELDFNSFSNIPILISVSCNNVNMYQEVFMNCVNLKTVEIHGQYSTIFGYNFYNCISLEKFVATSSNIIGEYDFANCRKLNDLQIPNVVILLKCSFKNCKSLVNFNSKPIYFYSGAFQGCSKLETVSFLHIENSSPSNEESFRKLKNSQKSLEEIIESYPDFLKRDREEKLTDEFDLEKIDQNNYQ